MSASPGKQQPADPTAGVLAEAVHLADSSPGAVLKKHRESKQIDLDYVAEHLNLSPGKVKALEADNYRALPSATFVKGYIRSYARFLGIPSQELVDKYAAISGCNKPKPEPKVEPPRIKPKGLAWLRLGALTGLVVMVLAVYWLWPATEFEPEEPTNDQPVALVAAEPAAQSEVIAVEPVVIDEPAVASTDTAPADTQSEPVEQETIQVSDSSVPVPAPAPATDSPGEKQPGILEMSFTGDCWVEVRNAQGDLIYADLKRLGDSLTLEGEPPLEAKLGNGNMVSLTYNGEPVSFRVPTHNVVRVHLGG